MNWTLQHYLAGTGDQHGLFARPVCTGVKCGLFAQPVCTGRAHGPCARVVRTDLKGIHELSCKLAAGRMPRHQALNDLIWRALTNAGVHSTKEPSGMSRTDGKRPDGLTLIPWQRGKSLAWDVTVVNTLADSYFSAAPLSQASVDEMATERKISKYSILHANIIFQPVAFETLGPIIQSGVDFIFEIGRRLEHASGDARERCFLFQRLSITVQRFNSVAFRGSFFLDTR